MTLQQLKYVVTVARTGSMSEASKELFISQPGLTTSIRELETEMGIKIFTRTNKGVVTSNEGERFLGYARQVLEQASLLEGVYKSGTKIKQQFCVSTQHYSFAVNAFVDLIRRFAGEEYDFSLRETETYEIIDDVAKMKSEIGILYLNSFNKDALMKIIKSKSLTFTELFTAKPHVFVGSGNPLAKREKITLQDLEPYPRLSYEQGDHNAFYFSEEILSTLESRKDIRVCDRATLFNLLIGLNGYTICSGVINETLNGRDIVAVPLEADDYMEIGYITHKQVVPGKFAMHYIEALKRFAVD